MRRRSWWVSVGTGLTAIGLIVTGCSSSTQTQSSSNTTVPPATSAAPATGAPIQPGPTEAPQNLTVDGQPLTLTVNGWETLITCTANDQQTNPDCAGPLDRGTQLTLGIINQGSSAVTLPSVLEVSANYTGDGCTSANVNTPSLNKDSDVLPGGYTTAIYQFLLDGAPGSCTVTSVEVSVNANNGSGSITLPINDTVPAPSS